MALQVLPTEVVVRRRSGLRRPFIVAGLVGVLVAAACSPAPQVDADSAEPAAAAAAPEPTLAAAAADEVAPSATAAPAASAPPPAATSRTVVGRGEGNDPGTWVEVTGLSRGADGMVTLKLTLVNESGSEEIGGYDLAHPDHQIVDFAAVGGVHLLDSRTRTKIEVDRGPGSRCLCSGDVSVRPGTRMHVWAKYSALDPTTSSVSVVVPGFEPVDNVAITAPTASVAIASAAAPIRSESETPGAWIEVTELARGADGGITLRFTLVNETAAELGGYDFAHPDHAIPDFSTVGGVYLLDGRSMTKWDVDRDSARKCVCSGGVGVRPGQRMRAWAKFSSVPPDATAVTIIVPGFEPVENVGIGAGPAS